MASAVYEVCDAVWQVLQPIYMKEPDEDDWKQIEHRFSTRWNFPNCVGALDGKTCYDKGTTKLLQHVLQL